MCIKNTENPWQQKIYKNKIIKKIVDLFIPKQGTKEYRKNVQLLKDSASHLKMEWLYVNRITICIITFVASIMIFSQMHAVAINYIYTEPTTDYDIIGELSEKDKKKAMEVTEMDNYFLDMFKGKLDTTQAEVETAFRRSKYYEENMTDEEISEIARRIVEDKLSIVNSEYMQWFEILLSFVFALLRIHVTNSTANVPSKNETIRNGRRSYAVPNNYTYAYEN